MGDGVSFCAMIGMGETYLAAFVLALGKGQTTAGLISTVPLVAGAVLQLVSPYALRRLGSFRKWVVLCAAIQSLSFVPLIAAALHGALSTPALFFIATVYWAAGMGTGPAWNTWIERLVPARLRARFFALRSRAGQLALLASLLVAGSLLQWGADNDATFVTFAIIFACAGLLRAASALFLSRQRDVPLSRAPVEVVPLRTLVGRVRHAEDGRLLFYMLSAQITVSIASPYFTPFMLEQLHLPYGQYMTLIAASFLAKVLVMPACARLIAKVGARRLLWLAGLGIVPLPAFWLVTDNFWFLMLAQLFSGVAWGAYELASMLLYFETIPQAQRTSLLTLFNLANAMALVCGSLLGSSILGGLGVTLTAYYVLFTVSTLLRAGTLFALRRVADVPVSGVPVFASRVLAARPSSGSIERPVVPSLPRGGRRS